MFGQTITTRFEEAKLRAERSGKCISCGKRRKRAFTYSNTVNPWNKDENGEVRSYGQVRQVVSDKLNEFMNRFDKRGFKCSSCEDELYGI